MRHRSTVAVHGLAATLLVATAPLAAQEISSPYRFVESNRELSFSVGAIGGAEGRFGLGAEDGVGFGAKVGFTLSDLLGVDFGLGYADLTRQVIDPTGEEGPVSVGEASVTQITIDARLRASLTGRRTWHRLQPYIFMGLGLRGDFADDQEADFAVAEEFRAETSTKFMVRGGVGMRFIPGQKWVARVELGGLLYRIDTPPGFSNEELGFEQVEKNEFVSPATLEFSLGFLF
ncbi:MAG: outer membrane beta-barrel protein [Longimicrobiales bacterium]|nr:outer membrane beta-barrel protein [Longimicrobiales bacterium]